MDYKINIEELVELVSKTNSKISTTSLEEIEFDKCNNFEQSLLLLLNKLSKKYIEDDVMSELQNIEKSKRINMQERKKYLIIKAEFNLSVDDTIVMFRKEKVLKFNNFLFLLDTKKELDYEKSIILNKSDYTWVMILPFVQNKSYSNNYYIKYESRVSREQILSGSELRKLTFQKYNKEFSKRYLLYFFSEFKLEEEDKKEINTSNFGGVRGLFDEISYSFIGSIKKNNNFICNRN